MGTNYLKELCVDRKLNMILKKTFNIELLVLATHVEIIMLKSAMNK
jgi:hypothetical protein